METRREVRPTVRRSWRSTYRRYRVETWGGGLALLLLIAVCILWWARPQHVSAEDIRFAVRDEIRLNVKGDGEYVKRVEGIATDVGVLSSDVRKLRDDVELLTESFTTWKKEQVSARAPAPALTRESVRAVSTAAHAPGTVRYRRGETFHLEVRAVYTSPEVSALYATRAHWGNPASIGYRVSDAARRGAHGVSFVYCPLTFDLRVEGLGNANLGSERFPLLDLHNRPVRYLTASQVGPGWVEFSGVTIEGGAGSVVVPHRFVQGRAAPVASIRPVNFTVDDPLARGGAYRFDLSRRVFANVGDDPRVSVGMVLPMQVRREGCR